MIIPDAYFGDPDARSKRRDRIVVHHKSRRYMAVVRPRRGLLQRLWDALWGNRFTSRGRGT